MDTHPLRSLEIPEAGDPLPRAFIDRWVVPLYMEIRSGNLDAISEILIAQWPDITEEVAAALLRQRGWRERLVGAHLAAYMDLREWTDWIGRLLLRSDVTYAGSGYCVALARFNTPESTRVIIEYLEYYLTRDELWYDQGTAMGALAYLDARNQTSNLGAMMGKWETFTANKPRWSLDRFIGYFAELMERVDALAAKLAAVPPRPR